MKWLDVYTGSNVFAFHELKAIISGAPERMRNSYWRVGEFTDADGMSFFEVAVDPSKDILAQLVDSGRRISFSELKSVAETVPQAIWASFFGYENVSDRTPWIVMSAVDSSFWRFDTSDMPTRNWIRSNFARVEVGQL